MFDIGFSELIVCFIVALIVIGPERMPEAVRTVGLWIGRLKRGLRSTREEFERQMGMDDIRRQLHNEEIMRSLESSRKEIDSVIEQGQHSIHNATQEITQLYGSVPDLPYHSHIDETHGNEAKANEAKKAAPKKTIAKKNTASASTTKTKEPATRKSKPSATTKLPTRPKPTPTKSSNTKKPI